MEANEIKLKTLLLSLLAIISVEAAAVFMTTGNRHSPMAVLGVARLVETILILLIVVILGKGVSSIGLSFDTLFSGLKKGLLWSAAVGLVVAVAFALLFAVGVNPIKLIYVRIPTKQSAMILFFFTAGVMGPIAEEVFFGVFSTGSFEDGASGLHWF
ncbi:MAG: hypothetical protein ABII68_06100 [Pseudomonadota bacterium]